MSNVFEWPVRVYFEDTDAGGIVYHARYLYFLERARTEWLRALGFSQSKLKQENVLFVIRDMNIKWQKPALLDDALTVSVKVTQIKKASLKMHQIIHSENEQKVQAEVTVACINAIDKKPMAIPQAIIDVIKKLDEQGVVCE
ncbi:MAG: tol-pal system-associated acyl-CoA thioesterase [Gammaproteobacteria bacterium]|nr:tol-pal system-associated acyl-CoA thioesterase [Gammaproteobacteria bacterium]